MRLWRRVQFFPIPIPFQLFLLFLALALIHKHPLCSFFVERGDEVYHRRKGAHIFERVVAHLAVEFLHKGCELERNGLRFDVGLPFK